MNRIRNITIPISGKITVAIEPLPPQPSNQGLSRTSLPSRWTLASIDHRHETCDQNRGLVGLEPPHVLRISQHENPPRRAGGHGLNRASPLQPRGSGAFGRFCFGVNGNWSQRNFWCWKSQSQLVPAYEVQHDLWPRAGAGLWDEVGLGLDQYPDRRLRVRGVLDTSAKVLGAVRSMVIVVGGVLRLREKGDGVLVVELWFWKRKGRRWRADQNKQH